MRTPKILQSVLDPREKRTFMSLLSQVAAIPPLPKSALSAEMPSARQPETSRKESDEIAVQTTCEYDATSWLAKWHERDALDLSEEDLELAKHIPAEVLLSRVHMTTLLNNLEKRCLGSDNQANIIRLKISISLFSQDVKPNIERERLCALAENIVRNCARALPGRIEEVFEKLKKNGDEYIAYAAMAVQLRQEEPGEAIERIADNEFQRLVREEDEEHANKLARAIALARTVNPNKTTSYMVAVTDKSALHHFVACYLTTASLKLASVFVEKHPAVACTTELMNSLFVYNRPEIALLLKKHNPSYSLLNEATSIVMDIMTKYYSDDADDSDEIDYEKALGTLKQLKKLANITSISPNSDDGQYIYDCIARVSADVLRTGDGSFDELIECTEFSSRLPDNIEDIIFNNFSELLRDRKNLNALIRSLTLVNMTPRGNQQELVRRIVSRMMDEREVTWSAISVNFVLFFYESTDPDSFPSVMAKFRDLNQYRGIYRYIAAVIVQSNLPNVVESELSNEVFDLGQTDNKELQDMFSKELIAGVSSAQSLEMTEDAVPFYFRLVHMIMVRCCANMVKPLLESADCTRVLTNAKLVNDVLAWGNADVASMLIKLLNEKYVAEHKALPKRERPNRPKKYVAADHAADILARIKRNHASARTPEDFESGIKIATEFKNKYKLTGQDERSFSAYIDELTYSKTLAAGCASPITPSGVPQTPPGRGEEFRVESKGKQKCKL